MSQKIEKDFIDFDEEIEVSLDDDEIMMIDTTTNKIVYVEDIAISSIRLYFFERELIESLETSEEREERLEQEKEDRKNFFDSL